MHLQHLQHTRNTYNTPATSATHLALSPTSTADASHPHIFAGDCCNTTLTTHFHHLQHTHNTCNTLHPRICAGDCCNATPTTYPQHLQHTRKPTLLPHQHQPLMHHTLASAQATAANCSQAIGPRPPRTWGRCWWRSLERPIPYCLLQIVNVHVRKFLCMHRNSYVCIFDVHKTSHICIRVEYVHVNMYGCGGV